jgi:molybdenum-dependent DNA-binding transcriptional regulator ModE
MVMRFSLRQIEYFVAAGEEGSILAASERLNISSASVSTAISQLEASFGIQLFIRHHAQGLSLTSQGRRFLGESKRLLAQVAGMHGFADEMAREIRGPLAVGCRIVFELLRSVPLADPHRPLRLGVARARESFRPKLLEAFEAHCRAVIHDDAIPGMAPPLQE